MFLCPYPDPYRRPLHIPEEFLRSLGRISKKYGGDKYVKTFSCWNQLAVMMFGQLSNRESLRDLVLATHAHANKAFHLGFGKHASKSTLADANANRDYRPTGITVSLRSSPTE